MPIPLTENKNVKKGCPSSKVMSTSSITHDHTKHHILDIQPESSGLCCFSLTLRPGTRENSGELDKYLTAREYSCRFLHIDVVDNVGRCWKIGLKPGKINSLTRGSSTNESQVTSPSLIFHLANVSTAMVLYFFEQTLPCQMWLQMAAHLALV